jgi:hypothetical protein
MVARQVVLELVRVREAQLTLWALSNLRHRASPLPSLRRTSTEWPRQSRAHRRASGRGTVGRRMVCASLSTSVASRNTIARFGVRGVETPRAGFARSAPPSIAAPQYLRQGDQRAVDGPCSLPFSVQLGDPLLTARVSIEPTGRLPNAGRTWFRSFARYQKTVAGSRSTTVSSHRVAHSPTVTFCSRGRATHRGRCQHPRCRATAALPPSSSGGKTSRVVPKSTTRPVGLRYPCLQRTSVHHVGYGGTGRVPRAQPGIAAQPSTTPAA